jgi:signal transduction histidine kinase/ActR/RegA family two-component response regulator
LLVIDVGCPGKTPPDDLNEQDPFDLCRRIKKQGQEAFLPVVLLLAQPDDAQRKHALESGADDVIMYPMQSCEFFTRLQAMLHLKMLHDRWRDTYHDLTMTRARLIKAERLTALGEMAGGVAHDFNNILSAILGRAQIMRRQLHDAELLRNLDIIERAANDGAATIRRIQNFSRSTSDKIYEHIDMVQVVHDCIQMTRTRWKDQAEYQSLTYNFTVDMPEELPVRGNAAELREVITNLIMNALDAMPGGGDVSFSGEISHDQILLNIADTGCGMEDEVLRRIFDPFFSTKKGDGTGLGLSVAYGIILRHHGKIECSSVKGSGTVFRIQLPHEEHQVVESVPVPLAAFDEAAQRNLRILVVDDEPAIREIFRDALEPEGHDVILAESGPTALKILETEKVDVLFTDLGMPEMSGWEVARRVHKIDPDVFIVLTSGWGQDFNQKQITKHGINYVLPKPVQFGTLLTLVHKVAMGLPVENSFSMDAK